MEDFTLETTNSPIFMVRQRCKKCGSTSMKINWMSWDGKKVEHADIYCANCDSFITHVNVSPYEE